MDRRGQEGEGRLSFLLWLLILGAVGTLAWQVVPAYYERYEVGLAFERALETVNPEMPDEEIRTAVGVAYRNLKLEGHSPGKIRISRKYGKVNLRYSYDVEIGLPFTPLGYRIPMTVSR